MQINLSTVNLFYNELFEADFHHSFQYDIQTDVAPITFLPLCLLDGDGDRCWLNNLSSLRLSHFYTWVTTSHPEDSSLC